MKKILAVAVMMVFCAGVGFADLNVKVGLDMVGKMTIDGDGEKMSVGNELGFSFAADYMYPVHDMIKIGAGAQYLVARDMDADSNSNEKFSSSYLPIFASIQVNPFSEAAGLFFKGNIGYNVLYDSGADFDGEDVDEKGGVYFGLGFGYEFDMGLFFDAMYGYYGSKLEGEGDGEELKTNTSQFTFSVGYKFKL